MKGDLPKPEEIIEELADKVTAQIERLAPVAFDSAYREMTQYHRFLLALGASRDPTGAPYNFAEIAGSAWHAPHRDWIRQYRRLFERAADKLVDEDHFIRSLAYAPSRLLAGWGDPELSPNVVRTILDLGPLLVSRLQAWVTKRTTVETRVGQAAEPRLALAGSDAKAYENLLPEIVGAWEGLLHEPPSMYGWREEGDQEDAERWAAFRASWPFLWQHLTNTAYCLALAVWNEDEVGAALFREALVRWTSAFDHHLNQETKFRHRRLLFPGILDLDWAGASEIAASLSYHFMPKPGPEQLFASVIRGAHDDVVYVTATLLLFWTMNRKQISDIGARTAQALQRREISDDDHRPFGNHGLAFRSLFLNLLRLEMSGERYHDVSHTANVDHLVTMLDNMTERRVVPGRVFTPTTLYGRDGLLLSDVATLLAYVPDTGDDGVLDRIAALALEEDVLPRGDASLRDILGLLERFRTTMEQPSSLIDEVVPLLAHGRDVDWAKARLREIVTAVSAAINDQRRRRLETRPADPLKLEGIRTAIEEALLTSPVKAPFFREVIVGKAASDENAAWRDISFLEIGKAHLTSPPMEPPSLNFNDWLVSESRKMAGNYAWAAFCDLPRTEVRIAATVESEEFWREAAPLLSQLGPEPILVISRNAEAGALRRLLYAPMADRPSLAIEQRSRDKRGAFYIATVEGVDVFSAEFQPGQAMLFSATTLRSVHYAQTDSSGRFVELTFELGEEMKGTLRVRVLQTLEWSDRPIFELKTSTMEDADAQ